MLDFLIDLFRDDVTGNHDDCIIRPVICSEPLVNVLEARGVEVLHRADYRGCVRVAFRIDTREDAVENLAVGLVVALPLLVLHHAALLIQFLLRNRPEQVAHAVRFHPQRHVQRRLRYVLEIIRAIEIRRAVHLGGAHQLEWLEVLVVIVFRAVEHQVFEEMCETGLATFFVFRTNVIPDVYGDDRRFFIFMDNQSQAVVERVFGEVDIDIGGNCVERKENKRQAEYAGHSE